MNWLRVENFLFCLSIRSGALTILWSIVLWFYYSLLLVWSVLQNTSSDDNNAVLLYLFIIISFPGMVTAVLAMIFFPAPNKTYSPNSATARFLKYFVWYFGCIIVMYLIMFSYIIVKSASTPETYIYLFAILPYALLGRLIALVVIPFFVTAILLHLMAVIYTFRLSILANNNLDGIHNYVKLS